MAFAPASDGSAVIAWTEPNNTLHVTPLNNKLNRRGPDIVVPGSEVGGIVARDDGFALLVTRSDPGEPLRPSADASGAARAVFMVRYRSNTEVFAASLTGTASITRAAEPTARDCSPGYLYSRLAWNGAKHGAYFIVRGCEGDPHFCENGDKLVYLDDNGGVLRGGWSWNCSTNQGLRMWPEPDVFTPVCVSDDAPFSGLNLVLEDRGPVLLGAESSGQNWSGRQFGSIVKFPSGTYVIGWLSRDTTSEPRVAARPNNDIAMLRLGANHVVLGPKRWLVETPDVAETNLHFAPYGSSRLLMIWDSMEDLRCSSTICFGTYTGTHARVLDLDGNVLLADDNFPAVPNTAGELSVMLNGGDVAWAYVPEEARNYAAPVEPGARLPAKRKVYVARLRMCE